ncbi:recombination protein U [Natranaerovirga pectinivora]|uniref:Holliday junction resolvase RecU n=1 Tax=Natranaerovirga pectinivora TaxID=682400 RepID=A0A4R3MUP0_9FIRM|nr:Holliday junction resolvase RecU [Natranaerovirga pectinivora]TCT17016.1 recombination protein U [Natranaerovirga pectinivora]
MAYWASRGLRGSTLEELINLTNEKYREKGLALIQKIPTPIKPIKIDKEKRHISLAYFEQKSTVDYIGVVQGIPICFDAKETSKKFLSIHNIHTHQIEFMESFEEQKGIAFLIVYFSTYDEYFYLPYKELKKYWYKAIEGGKKSINYTEFSSEYKITTKNGLLLHYLEGIKKELENSKTI